MKLLFDLPVVLLTVFLICCSAPQPTKVMQEKRPDDLAVEYQWRAGSMPPPYHYEYMFTIKPNGQSQIVFIPDYPSAAAPQWVESLMIEEERLDELYRVMVENGLFTRKWRQTDNPPVGGSSQSLAVTARGKRVLVEDYLVSEQQAPAEKMYAAVRALVPKDVWERLQAKRQQYMQEHPR